MGTRGCDSKDISVNPPLRSTEEKFQTWFPHLLQQTAFYGFTGGINHWNINLSFRVLHRRLYKRFYQHIENMTFTDNKYGGSGGHGYNIGPCFLPIFSEEQNLRKKNGCQAKQSYSLILLCFNRFLKKSQISKKSSKSI